MNPTLFGAYKSRPTLFDGLELPASVNKDDLLDLLIQEYGASPVLIYMPDMLEMAIGSWSSRKSWEWERLASLLAMEYDPLSNYDRHEMWDESDTYGRSDTRTDNLTDSTTYGRSDTRTDNLTEAMQHGHQVDQSRAAYDSGDYSPTDREVNSGTDTTTNTGTQTSRAAGTDATGHTGTQTHQAGGSDANHREGRAWGNIGVTTSQQMFQAELELLTTTDLYQIIAGEFADRFILPIW